MEFLWNFSAIFASPHKVVQEHCGRGGGRQSRGRRRRRAEAAPLDVLPGAALQGRGCGGAAGSDTVQGGQNVILCQVLMVWIPWYMGAIKVQGDHGILPQTFIDFSFRVLPLYTISYAN